MRSFEAAKDIGGAALRGGLRRRLGVLSNGIFYMPGDSKKAETYGELKELLKKLDSERGTQGNRAFYLFFAFALPGHSGEPGRGWIERRRGRRLVEAGRREAFRAGSQSARDLNAELQRYFDETQIYRIDHYLGKETVQNILALRFANGIFEPVWNQHYVDHVQITVAEDIGVGTRGAFYEEAGAMRDIVQNHVMQVLCLTAMEPPVTFDAESVREEKVKVLRAVRPIPEDEVENYAVRGQYERGWVWGEEVPGYREKNVDPESVTETFVALKVFVDNWRWARVPFYIRAGGEASQEGDGGRHPVPLLAAYPFRPRRHRGPRAERPRHSCPARRGALLKIGAKVPAPASRSAR